MFRKLNSFHYLLSRSKLRKGPQFEPHHKDYASTYGMKKKINAERQLFQMSAEETFTEAISNPNPKLKERFKIDTDQLNHDLKKMIKLKIKPQNLQPYSEDGNDLKFLQEGRSYLNDQRAQVAFEQKFRKELFMKTQTTRMLKKQANKFTNFLPQNSQNKYNKYLEAKMKLKNNRIESMMGYKRHNQELQLLLDSGFMDDPSNIGIIVNKLHSNGGAQQIQKNVEVQMRQIDQKSDKSIATTGQLEYSLQESLHKNVIGPEQLRDYSKIQQFLQVYSESNEQDKLKASQDVDLLLQIREYERSLFLSRYQQINFRFKGRVKFENFKQFELLSYIKHQEILPQQLLQLFDQNGDKLSKFNVPVITPAVMSRIYSKTSTYRFAQNDQNNHINFLSHPIFVKLEKALFRELDKISDELYCDAVWTYAKNHEHEEGVLNLKMSNAIQRAIFGEMLERMGRLREADLGLLVRSFMKLNMLSDDEYKQKWGEVTEFLRDRLPLMKEPYEYESVMEFVHLLPATSASIDILVSNINFFNKFTWQDRGTLLTFARVCSNLIINHKLIDPLQHNKTFIRLSQVITNKLPQLKQLIPTLTINQISNVLIIFSQLNKYPLAKQIPPILINIAKKEIVDSLRMQKHKVYQYAIPTIINTLSVYDYHKNIVMKNSKYINSTDLLTPFHTKNIMKIIPLKHLLPGRTFIYNSKLYFIYHQLAKFLQTQNKSLSLRSIAESLFGLSLINYKNEGLYDTMSYRVMQKLQQDMRQQKREMLTYKQTSELIKIVNCYSLQKRNTDLIQEIFDKIIKEGKHHFRNIQPNIIISFFNAYLNIFSLSTEYPKEESPNYQIMKVRWGRNKASAFIFAAIYRDILYGLLQKLQEEELITLYMINTHFLNNTSRILQENDDYSIQSEFGQLNRRLKKNVVELLSKIGEIEKEKLQVDYRFAIAICYKLNKLDLNGEERGFQGKFGAFEDIEKDFYDRYIEEMLNHQQHVGSAFTYKQTYQNLLNKLKKQHGEENLKERTWRIEVLDKKIIYFIATYEHLMAKYHDQKTSLGLFGLWKTYAQLYRRKKWSFQLVCSMLE